MPLASLGDQISEWFRSFVDAGIDLVWSTPPTLPWLVVLLLGTGVYVTIRMSGIQFRVIGHALRIVRGDYDDPEYEGDVSHFQALCTALSATVGIGNIAGVATAVHFGGPGAIFWMWVTAVFGMCLKYVEVSLAMKYRDFDAAGNASGGPQKYIQKIPYLRGLTFGWKPMAVFFAVCAIISSFGAGNMNQINTMSQTLGSTFGIPDWLVGGACVLLIGSVILGGITRIGRVTSILMPVMAGLYFFSALVYLLMNAGELGGAFGRIIEEAFSPRAGFAGTAAGVWSTTLLWGVKRGLFSNESGQGSAPIAHAAAKTNEPLREGIVALLGPLIDTLIICSMTGLVIIVAGNWEHGVEVETTLADKELRVMTWSEGDPVTLETFGRARGLRGEPATIEPAGYEGRADDGTADGAKAIAEKLVIEEGRPTRILHPGRPSTGAVLMRHDGPVNFKTPDQVITRSGRPFSGEVIVKGGVIEDPLAAELDIKANMVLTGADLTKNAFAQTLGRFGELMVTLTVLLFALSTAISWSYYGDRCAEYLMGLRAVFVYRIVFLGFVYLGAVLPLQTVWDFGDLALGLMTVPNLIAVILLAPVVRKMQDEYFSRRQEPTRKRD